MTATHRRLAAISLGVIGALAACNGFDPDDPYRCAHDDECITGYRCELSVCIRATAELPHRVLYQRGGEEAELLARKPGDASAVAVSSDLAKLGWPPGKTKMAGGFSPQGEWLVFSTTGGPEECAEGYSCLAIASGDLKHAALVVGQATSAPIHPRDGPMDIDDDATHIVYATDAFQVRLVRRLAGEPLVGGAWGNPVLLDQAAPQGSEFGSAPVLLPYGARDRVAWQCGTTDYPTVGQGICQVTIMDGDLAPGGQAPQRIGADILPGDSGEWLSSPRYAWIGGEARIAFIAQASGVTSIWHAALDGTDPRKVTSVLAGEAELESICVFGGHKVAAMMYDSGAYRLEWLDMTGGDPLVLDAVPGPDPEPPPGLLGCH